MVLILDGGSTSVLDHLTPAERAEVMKSPLWTSQALYSYPAAVHAMYKDYISSGADLISCMTYQQSDMTMGHVSRIPDAYDVGMRIALQSSLGSHASPVLTLGTHAAMLGNGAEYSHTYGTEDVELLSAFHTKRLQQFASMNSWKQVTYIAFETLPDVLEAQVILDVLSALPQEMNIQRKKIWISFSCAGDNAVQKVLLGVEGILKHPHLSLLWGLGVNCFKEDKAAVVEPFCNMLSQYNLFAVIYRDAGPQWDAIKRNFVGEPMQPHDWARSAVSDARFNHGRIVIGGCCQTTPQHIAALRNRLTKANKC